MEAIFACSGPGAGAAIGKSILLGYAHAAFAGSLLMASWAVAKWFFHRWTVPTVLLGLLVLHPAWTISAISGDCGFLKRDTSLVFTAAGCLALAWQVAQGRRPPLSKVKPNR